MQLKDKTAIVTGGANGIGRETTLKFVSEGCRVMIWDVDADKAAETQKMAGDQSSMIDFMSVDIRSYEAVEEAVAKTVESLGKIDILINNAGVTADSTLKKMTPDQWQKVIDVNLTGVFNCGKAVALHMMDTGGGRIINTSSVVAHNGNFGQSNYVATKTGVIGLAKVWAKELGRYGITVNAVAPGFINTDMIKTVPEKVLDGLRGQTPLGRLGEPSDIANAYIFLASEKASFITGAVLNVDGGLKL
ncbi:MAG TPA: 3-oxoacyl-ACP reductase FabG [Cryomorphaceae bacterium]|nr:3-oxoacyl-ACP reductase FabG [Cryomorphaceae bacterium]